MSVSIWTDPLAVPGSRGFNLVMARHIPFVLAALGLIGLLLLAYSQIGTGPDVTGPAASQVVVDDVPNPVAGPPDPSEGGEELVEPSATPEEIADIWAVPEGFRQLLDRDAILPIYDPAFVSADQSDWPDNALVVGVALNGEARAYPVGYLNRREMVIDTVGGIPVLVTW